MLGVLCEKNGITSTIYQETLDAFTLEDYKAIYD